MSTGEYGGYPDCTITTRSFKLGQIVEWIDRVPDRDMAGDWRDIEDDDKVKELDIVERFELKELGSCEELEVAGLI